MNADASVSLSLSVPLYLSLPPSSSTLASDHFPQITAPSLPVPLPRGLLSSGLLGSNFMPCRCHRLAALITRSFCCLALWGFVGPSTPLYHLLTRIVTMSSRLLLLFKRLCSNRRAQTLHHLLLQGDILPSRGPRHTGRPAPLVVQVLVSLHVIDWDEGLVVLGSPALFSHVVSCGFVLRITRQDPDKTKEPVPLPLTPSTVRRVLAPDLLAFSLCSFT